MKCLCFKAHKTALNTKQTYRPRPYRPDDVRRHPPAEASAVACSGIGPIAGMDLLVVVVTVCEVDPSETGLCEVGPAETGLARSASCRSDGRRARVLYEPGRKRVVVRCCPVTSVNRWSVTDASRGRNGSEPPIRRCLPAGVVVTCCCLVSLMRVPVCGDRYQVQVSGIITLHSCTRCSTWNSRRIGA